MRSPTTLCLTSEDTIAQGGAIGNRNHLARGLAMSSALKSQTRQQSGDIVNAPSIPSDVRGASRNSGLGIHSLTYREVRRRLYHMLPGCLAFLLHVVPHQDPVSTTLRWIIVGLCCVIGLQVFRSFRRIQRLGEGSGGSAVAGYSLSVLVAVLLFPQHLEIALSVLAILAFGDGSATLFGLLFRGPRLPWNHAKSWCGFVAFVICGTLLTGWIYWGETHNPEATNAPVTFLFAVMLVMPAVVLSALAESVQSRINDNIRVGVTAAVSVAAMHFLCTMAF
jgi:dolichol kinase